MTAKELINEMIPPLRKTDSVASVLNWMNEFKVNQLPVVEEQALIGIVTDDLLIDCEDIEASLEVLQLPLQLVAIQETRHLYDVLKLANQYQLEVVPVVDDQNRYIGVISIRDTALALSRSFAAETPGSILVLSMRFIDYSLANISRLIEENKAKILSVFVEADPTEHDKIVLTLKLNVTNLKYIVATLERFDYKILALYQEEELQRDANDRLDMFFKFLEI